MLPSTSPWPTRWLVVLICLVFCASALAQSTGGRILGRVTDPTGAVLAHVKVTATWERPTNDEPAEVPPPGRPS